MICQILIVGYRYTPTYYVLVGDDHIHEAWDASDPLVYISGAPDIPSFDGIHDALAYIADKGLTLDGEFVMEGY